MKHSEDDRDAEDLGIGERLRAERQRLGYAQADFGAAVGVSKTTQFNYEAGDRTPDARYLRKAAALGMDLLQVVTGTRHDDGFDRHVWIPALRGHGSGEQALLNEETAAYEPDGLCFGKDWIEHRKLSVPKLTVVTVRGSSMEGVLFDGDRVLVDQQDLRPRSGFVYVLRQGSELLVKYCQMLPGGMLRVSNANPSFGAYDIDLANSTDVEIVGRVVASVHEW